MQPDLRANEGTGDFDRSAFARGAGSGIGYIYCLSNPAMPGLVKIGYTNRSTATRAQELSFGTREAAATGVPMPFAVVKDWRVPADRAEEVEQQVHRMLHKSRVPAHGRWKAKEFFHFQPDDAVIAIERVLQELDWLAVAQAELVQFDATVQARENRRLAQLEAERKAADLEKQIQSEIDGKKAQWRKAAISGKADAGQTEGLKWGFIWFAGACFALFVVGNSKDAALWLCLGFGVVAYYMTKDGPGRDYLNSEEAQAALSRIEAEVRRRFPVAPLGGIDSSHAVRADPGIHTEARGADRQSGRENFQERYAAAQDLIAQQREDQVSASKVVVDHFDVSIERRSGLHEFSAPVEPVRASEVTHDKTSPQLAPAAVSPPPSTQRIQAPPVSKHDVTCPNCRANLHVHLEQVLLTQKIQCPSCTRIFMLKEGRNSVSFPGQPRDDLESMYRDAY